MSTDLQPPKFRRPPLRAAFVHEDNEAVARPGFPAEPTDRGQPAGDGTILPQARTADAGVIARQMIVSREIQGQSSIRYWAESFWRWHNGRYIRMTPDEVRAEVVRFMEDLWSHIKKDHISNVVEHLKAIAIISSEVSPPAWLGPSPRGFDAQDCLATPGEIIHLPSLASGRRFYSVPATPALFTFNASECNFDPKAKEPVAWERFLSEVFGCDRESIDTLQEFFGYFLTADTRQQKMLLLVGPKRSGKGTIARVLRKVVGEANVAGPTLAHLATNFGLGSLVGKSLAIISDARISSRLDQGTVLERLLAISGEDKLTIDRKFATSIDVQLPTRVMMLSNELPRLADASGTIVSRFITLETRRSFFGTEDPHLTRTLLQELPEILLWAVEGWKRLHERGHFIQPSSSIESLASMTALASPVTAFVKECCQCEPNAFVPVDRLYKAFQDWCALQGHRSVPTTPMFGRDLLAAFPSIKSSQRRIGDQRPRGYQGIQLANSSYRNAAGQRQSNFHHRELNDD